MIRSVAFVPVPMMVVGLALGIGLFYLEQHTEISVWLSEYLPSVVVNSQDTARGILGLFIGGMMTLVVFTFTQMMTLYNQVANSYSPRLLEQFTGAWSLQSTMGFYLGTILMNTMVMLSIGGLGESDVPTMSVLTCVLFDLLSLALFLYFVTTASSKIHADKIINTTFKNTTHYLTNLEEDDRFEERPDVPDTTGWYSIASPIDGYLGVVDHATLSDLAGKFNTRLFIGAIKGDFIPRSFPLIETERALSEEQTRQIVKTVSPITRTYRDWHLPQLQLLIEIAMKAMSPGINDPGTAHSAIDGINGILGHLMFVPNHNYIRTEKGGEVWFERKTFQQVMRETFIQLRNYSRQDTMVTRSLIKVAYQLYGASSTQHTNHKAGIKREIQALVQDAREYITNEHDRAMLTEYIKTWNGRTRELLVDTTILNGSEIERVGTPVGDGPYGA